MLSKLESRTSEESGVTSLQAVRFSESGEEDLLTGGHACTHLPGKGDFLVRLTQGGGLES